MAGFRDILSAAQASYTIVPFREVENVPRGKPYLILRHDVDHSLELALAMAREEEKLGVRASYFVLVTAGSYNVLAPDSQRTVRAIADMGHEVGLHYAISDYLEREGDGLACFKQDMEIVGRITGQPALSASAHDAVNAGLLNVGSLARFHAYDPQFTQTIPYVSDSNQAWRQWHPLDLIQELRSFQLLLHPLWWVLDGRDWEQKLRIVESQANARYAAFIESEIQRQRTSLLNREKLDGAFQGHHATAASSLAKTTESGS
jgi:hypothetical protein